MYVACLCYRYEDGDVEDVDYEELLKILVKDKEPIRKKEKEKREVEKEKEKVVEKPPVETVPVAARGISPELISFHKEAPPVTVDEEETRSRAMTTDAVLQKSVPKEADKESVQRRDTADGVLGKKASKWKLASASTLSNKLNSHNQSRGNKSPPRPNASPRANSGIAARWLQAARSDSEAEKVTDADKGTHSADERRSRPGAAAETKKKTVEATPVPELKLSPKRPSQKDRDLEPLSPISTLSPKERRSSLKEPNSPKLGPKRKLSWRLHKGSDSEAKEKSKTQEPLSPLSPNSGSKKSPRSPKMNRWDVDALKKQAKEAEGKVTELRLKHRTVMMRAILGQ